MRHCIIVRIRYTIVYRMFLDMLLYLACFGYATVVSSTIFGIVRMYRYATVPILCIFGVG